MTSRTRYFVIASLLVLDGGPGHRARGLLRRASRRAPSARRGGPDELQLRAAGRRRRRLRQRSRGHELRAAAAASRRACRCPENGQREFQRPDRHQHRNRHRPRRGVPRSGPAATRPSERRPGAGARPVRRGQDRGAHARARRPRRGLQAASACSSWTTRWHPKDDDMSSPTRRTGPRRAAPRELRALVPRARARRGRQRRARAQAPSTSSTAARTSPTNDELMDLVRSLDGGNAWAVGRFDALRGRGAAAAAGRQPDSRDHLVLGERPHQRRSARHAPRRSARRGGGQQPARRRARVHGARQAADRRRSPSCRPCSSRSSSAAPARPSRCRSRCRPSCSTCSARRRTATDSRALNVSVCLGRRVKTSLDAFRPSPYTPSSHRTFDALRLRGCLP